jgi:nucleotide-binding universal stress UspA family protein
MDTILVSIDDSTQATMVLTQAALVARTANAGLRVLHVIQEPQQAHGIRVPPSAQVTEEAERLVAEGVASAAALGVTDATGHVVIGDPGPAICDTAEEFDADLIVVGSRGHGRVLGAVLGSVAQHVSARAKQPVLITR